MDMSYEEAKAKLQAQNQEQVLANYSRLEESTQKELREILLKNAKVLMSEKYKTEYQEISGKKKKEKE